MITLMEGDCLRRLREATEHLALTEQRLAASPDTEWLL